MFHYATVSVEAQNGLAPVALPTIIEGSACFVNCAYFDDSNSPFTPADVRYRVEDMASLQNIVPWTGILPNVTNKITVTFGQNQMVSNSRSSETRQVIVQVTDGQGNPFYFQALYNLLRVAGLG